MIYHVVSAQTPPSCGRAELQSHDSWPPRQRSPLLWNVRTRAKWSTKKNTDLLRLNIQARSTAAAMIRMPPMVILKLAGQQARAKTSILTTNSANRREGDVGSDNARVSSSYLMLSSPRKVVGGGINRGVEMAS